MHLDFDSLSDAEIIGLLGRTGAVPVKGDIQLQRHPANSSRKDATRRISMRVWVGSEATIHLTIGRGLTATHRKTVAFHRHNPEIAVRPLFLVRHGGVDFFGQECAGLFNLDEALASRRIDAAGWRDAVTRVAAALLTTNRPSTPPNLLRECAEFEEAVLAMDTLTKVDTIFLRDTVFPVIRQEASRSPVFTAWSNGDFVAKNIVLDRLGRPRLVDCEFAARTHFSAEDWFRLRHFSSMPAGTTVADLGAPPELPAWLEIRGWLNHALKMNAVCAPDVTQADLPKISARLLPLVEACADIRGRPIFFDLRGTGVATTRDLPASFEESLGVEWAGQSGDRFKSEPPVPLRAGEWNELQVDLSAPPGRSLRVRLRLPESPCMLEFRRIEVHGRERGQILWTADPGQLHMLLSCSGNLLDINTAEGLGIVHFGGESHVSLPPLRVSRAITTAGVSLWVRYVPHLHDFSQALRRSASEGGLPSILGNGAPLLITTGAEAKPAIAQLFLPSGNSYLEENSSRLPLSSPSAWNELAFDVPPQPEGAILRFDPADQPGLCDLSSLSLNLLPGPMPAGQRVVRDWIPGIRCEGDALLVPAEDGIRLLIFGSDPILRLAPIPADFADKPLQLKICLRLSPAAPTPAWAAALKEKHTEAINLNVRLHQAASLASANAQESSRMGTAHAEALKAIADLRTTLTGVQHENHNQRHELSLREKRIAEITEAAQKQSLLTNEELSSVKHEADGLRHELARLQTALAEANHVCTQQQDIVAKAQTELTGAHRQQAEQEALLDERARLFSLETDRHKQEIENAAAKMLAVQGALQESERTRSTLLSEKDELGQALRSAQSEIESLRNSCTQLQASLDAKTVLAGSEHDKLTFELESLRREAQSLREQLDRESKARQQAILSVASLHASAEKLRAELMHEQVRANSTSAESARLAAALTDAKQRLTSQESTLTSRDGELLKARAELAALAHQVSELGRKADAVSIEFVQAQGKAEQHQQEISRLNSDLTAAAQLRATEAARFRQALEESVASQTRLQAELDETREINQGLQADLTRLGLELAVAERDIALLRNESQEAKISALERESELMSCRQQLNEQEAGQRAAMQAAEDRFGILTKRKAELLESLYAQNAHIDALGHRLRVATQERNQRISALSDELDSACTRHAQERLTLEQQHAQLVQELQSCQARAGQLLATLTTLRERLLLRLDAKARHLIDSTLHPSSAPGADVTNQ